MIEPLLIFVAAGIGALLWRSFATSYASEKGRNLATKEDIAAITAKVEEVKTEHARRLKELDQTFAFGAAAHMAEVVFDKHVAFCTEYSEALLASLPRLIGDGPSEKAELISQKLHGIRRTHQLWVTADLGDRLDQFERALFKMATDAAILRETRGPESRRPIIDRMHDTWQNIIGIGGLPDAVVDEKINAHAVVRTLQNILGIDRLTELRAHVLERAVGDT